MPVKKKVIDIQKTTSNMSNSDDEVTALFKDALKENLSHHEFLKTLSSFNPLEQNAPLLQKLTALDWMAFKLKNQKYQLHNGIQSIWSRCTPTVQYTISLLLKTKQEQLKLLSDDQLDSFISKILRTDSISNNFETLMSSKKMADNGNEVYNEQNIDTYIYEYCSLFAMNKALDDESTGATQKERAYYFVEGLRPLYFKELVNMRSPKTMDQVLDAIYALKDKMEVHQLIQTNLGNNSHIKPKKIYTNEEKEVYKLKKAEDFKQRKLKNEGKLANISDKSSSCFNCKKDHHLKDCPHKQLCLPLQISRSCML